MELNFLMLFFFLITVANVILVKGFNLKNNDKLEKTNYNTNSRDGIDDKLIETRNKLKAKMKESIAGRISLKSKQQPDYKNKYSIIGETPLC